MEKLKSFKTWAIVALIAALIILSNKVMDDQVKIRALSKEVATVNASFDAYKIEMKKKVDDLNSVYTEREKTNDHFRDQVIKYQKDGKRLNVVLAKPKLVESLINKSFNEFSRSLSKETQ